MLVAAGVIAFYFWTAASGGQRAAFGGDTNDYYNLLARGFLDGHLHMKVTPDPALRVELPNRVMTPDAAWLLDASFYRGKYYLYFGATPALTLFVPWRVLTGTDFPEWAAVPLLAAGAFLIALAWLAGMRREFFPRVNGWTWMVAVAALGLANGVPMVLRRPLFYEVAVTAGWLWSAAGLYFLTKALLQSERAIRWLAAASVCAGLAVGSRPTLIAGGTVALAGATWWLVRRSRGDTVRLIAAATLPLGAAVISLLWYNWARFENPLEFGLHHQLGSNGNGFPFTLESLGRNLRVYYFTPPDVGWFFPFVTPGPKPVGYYFEQVHGQFWILPFMLFSALAFVRFIRDDVAKDTLRVIALTALAWAVASLGLVGMAPVQSNRYALDFHPMLFSATLLGWLAAAHAGRRAWTAVGTIWLVGLMFLNAGASWHVHHFFQEGNSRGFERFARWCDRVVWPVFRLTRPALGTIETEVVFPRGAPGQLEPLVVAGAGTDVDSVMVHYLDAEHARLEFNHQGVGGREGATFALRPGERRKLVLSLGTLCPPAWHPWYDSLPAGAGRLATHVRAMLDGAEVLALDAPCFHASPNQLTLGQRGRFLGGNPTFRGKIEFVRGQGPDLDWLRASQEEAGALRLRVRFPRDRFGAQEPLAIAGLPEQFDLVCVRYEDPKTVRIGMHHAGWPVVRFSPPLPVDYEQMHEVEIELGAFAAGSWLSAAQREAWRGRGVSVRLDGRTVLVERFVAHPAEKWQLLVGCTPYPVGTSRQLFAGEMGILPRRSATRRELDSALKSGRPLQLRLRFSPARPGMREPLLTTGVAGKGDGLYVWYVDGEHIRIGFDHWGVGGVESPPMRIDYEAEHDLTIALGSLLADGEPGRGKLRVTVDGKVAIDAAQGFHPTTANEVTIGLNAIGLSTAEAAFTGQILSVGGR